MAQKLVLKMIFIIVLLVSPIFALDNSLLLDGRIIGGSDISITGAPYQVSLEYYERHICGGAIISPKYVITAAHCTNGKSNNDFAVRAGTSVLGDPAGQLIKVSRIYQNSNYSKVNMDYDISVLELNSFLKIDNNFVKAATLPLAASDNLIWKPGSLVLVTGWGTTIEGSSTLPKMLQGVYVNIIKQEECKAAYGSSAITKRMFCAGVIDGGKDSCQGDSGGPLHVVSTGELGGLVSWGRGCGDKGYPGVYANLASLELRDFIFRITGL